MDKEVSRETDLYQRLLDGEETASSALFDIFYDELVRYFATSFKLVEEDSIKDIVANSLFELIDNPTKYKPDKGTLKSYLRMDIRGDINNSIQKNSLQVVELSEEIRNSSFEGSLEKNVGDKQALLKIKEVLQTWFPSTVDFELAWLIICGEKDNTGYSTVLSLEQLSIEEQRTEVKRHKDRIKKQLERKGWHKFLDSIK